MTKKVMKALLIYLAIVFPPSFTAMILGLSGVVAMTYEGYAVDSAERIYVGKNTGIEVYDGAEKIRTISPRTSRCYKFTVQENDTILLSTGKTVYLIDQDGETIEQYQDDLMRTYRDIESEQKHFTSASGTEYEQTNMFGYYRIMRSDGVCVYSMPWLDYAARIVFFLAFISLFIFIPVLIKKARFGNNSAPTSSI